VHIVSPFAPLLSGRRVIQTVNQISLPINNHLSFNDKINIMDAIIDQRNHHFTLPRTNSGMIMNRCIGKYHF